jgi:hypothetical protein
MPVVIVIHHVIDWQLKRRFLLDIWQTFATALNDVRLLAGSRREST